LPIFPTSLSFGALARYVPFGISHYEETSHGARPILQWRTHDHSLSRSDMIRTSMWQTVRWNLS